MPHLRIAALLVVCSIIVQACDRIPTTPTATKAAEQDPIVQDLDRLEAGVRIAAANKRIDDLEHKVGELESTPEKLDLDLLTSRVTALEVKANGAALASDMLLPKEKPSLSTSTGAEPQARKNTRQTPKRTSVLNLPELESRPRLATPAEAKAFAPGK
ncbi:hypothetical protein [Sphingomonas faeni]|uniref:hypothetical protein n=1 Tax=Sphingomonas faeni TaxID=185950 RepID=UPI00277E9F7E|nr:hypothetical protein [Sphingomonas faeni]MDQ0836967.1 hypothetical protein [Sphingomonas faeni]